MRTRRLTALLAAGAVALALAACNGAAGGSKPSGLPDPPLPTSFTAGGAAYAVVPMGHLSDRLNTFWQLLRREPGGRWLVDTPPGVGTNGGLVVEHGWLPLRQTRAAPLQFGFLPSDKLAFTPLIATTDGGRHWRTSVLDYPLAPVPSSLTADRSVAAALSRVGGGTLLVRPAGANGFKAVATAGDLAASRAGRRCGAASLTAVSAGARALGVGVACTKEGASPLYRYSGGRFTPLARFATEGATSEVLAIEPGAVLLATRSAKGVSLIARGHIVGGWNASGPLLLRPGYHLQSIARDGRVLSVLLAKGTPARPRSELLMSSSPAGSKWRVTGHPPDGTQAFFSTGQRYSEVLAVRGSQLTVYRGYWRNWKVVERLGVPIQYGSAS